MSEATLHCVAFDIYTNLQQKAASLLLRPDFVVFLGLGLWFHEIMLRRCSPCPYSRSCRPNKSINIAIRLSVDSKGLTLTFFLKLAFSLLVSFENVSRVGGTNIWARLWGYYASVISLVPDCANHVFTYHRIKYVHTYVKHTHAAAFWHCRPETMVRLQFSSLPRGSNIRIYRILLDTRSNAHLFGDCPPQDFPLFSCYLRTRKISKIDPGVKNSCFFASASPAALKRRVDSRSLTGQVLTLANVQDPAHWQTHL